MTIFILTSCAERPSAVKGWSWPSQGKAHDLMGAFAQRSRGIQAIKGQLWARVTVDGGDRPSVRSRIYWMKDQGGGALFRVVGLGPFSVTIFDAMLDHEGFQLILTREGVVYWMKPGGVERHLARLLFDPWAIAAIEGAEYEASPEGGVIVQARVQGQVLRGEFSHMLNPISMASGGIEVSYALPRRITVTLRRHSVHPIRIELRLSRLVEASREEVRHALEGRPDVSGFRIYPLEEFLLQRLSALDKFFANTMFQAYE